MAKKRAKVNVDFSDKTDLFSPTEQKPKERSDRILKRASYDMTPELKKAVMKRAYKLGISASQLAMFLLCDALQRFDSGDIDPSPWIIESESPRFRNSLEIGEWYEIGNN